MNALFEADPAAELHTARAEAQAWKASQQTMVKRVQHLEEQLLHETARSTAIQAAREEAERSLILGFEEFQHQNARLSEEFAKKESELAAKSNNLHAEALTAAQDDIRTLLAENSRLKDALEHDHRDALERRGRLYENTELRETARALAHKKKELENQVVSLQGALHQERQLTERLDRTEALATQATEQAETACRQRDELAQQTENALQTQRRLETLLEEGCASEDAVRRAAKEQVAVLSEVAHQRGAALHRIINLLQDTTNTTTSAAADTTKNECERAVELVMAVCGSIVEAEAAWEGEKLSLNTAFEESLRGSEDLSRRLRDEEARSKQLEEENRDIQHALHAVHEMAEGAAQLESRALAAEEELQRCREELEQAAATAAASLLQVSQLKTATAVAEEQRHAAEEEAGLLRENAETLEQRADEMRAAAAVAMQLLGDLQLSICSACASSAAQLRDIAARCFTPDEPGQVGHVLAVVDSLHGCIDKLEAVAETRNVSATVAAAELGNLVKNSLEEAVDGYNKLATLVQEHQRVHSVLSRAVAGDNTADMNTVDKNNDNDDKESSSLEMLLGALLDRFAALTECVRVEKVEMEKQLIELQREHEDLLHHAESLDVVLRSAVHAGPGMDAAGEALVQLAASRRRVSQLEGACKILEERAQQAQHAATESKASAAQNWAEVRADVAQLVQHAERAQIEADAALQQQRVEAARQIAAARAKEHAAATARSEAEAEAAHLREERSRSTRDLQHAVSTVSHWEQRAAGAETALAAAQQRLETQQEEVQQSARDEHRQAHEANELTQYRRKIAQLDGALADLQEHAAATASQLIEARSKAEALEVAVASHQAATDAATRSAEAAAANAAETQARAASLELLYLEATSQLQQQQQQQKSSSSSGTNVGNPPVGKNPSHTHPSDTAIFDVFDVPASIDAPSLRRRLIGALQQIESLRLLNANLEQQICVTADLTRRSNSQTMTTTTTTKEEEQEQEHPSVELAHALIDALQAQMRCTKSASAVAASKEEESSRAVTDSSSSPVERVVALWKEAIACRDHQVAEAQHRLQAALLKIDEKDGEIAAMRTAADALRKARREAVAAAAHMEGKLRNAENANRGLAIDVAAAAAVDEERAALQKQVSTLHSTLNQLQSRVDAAEAENVQLERMVSVEKAAAVKLCEQLRGAEMLEEKVAAAENRAVEAEKTLARHLETVSQQGDTSLGQQLEIAWATERELAHRLQDLQIESTGAKSQLEAAMADAQMYCERSAALEDQLTEAVAALADQGAALEALQALVKEESENKSDVAVAAETRREIELLRRQLAVAELREEIFVARLKQQGSSC